MSIGHDTPLNPFLTSPSLYLYPLNHIQQTLHLRVVKFVINWRLDLINENEAADIKGVGFKNFPDGAFVPRTQTEPREGTRTQPGDYSV